MLKGRHLLEPEDFSQEELESVLKLAGDIMKNPEKYKKKAEGKILATLFYEPSTRTRLSFEAAMLRLGGKTIGFSDVNSSSVTKGENIADTAKIVAAYADAIVMRHPKEGAPKVAAMESKKPVVNAGDGGHNHPTQTLTDLFTIMQEKKRLDNLKIAICGDLKFGRTTHSLVKALARYEGNEFVFISPKELKMPKAITKGNREKRKIKYVETEDMDQALGSIDILYMTRVQKERFTNEEEYIRLKDKYIYDSKKLEITNQNALILHPLPRVNEISKEVDSDPRAAYFRQAENGMYVRMALLMAIMGLMEHDYRKNSIVERKMKKEINITENFNAEMPKRAVSFPACKNPRCITTVETGIAHDFRLFDKEKGDYACVYCDEIIGSNREKQ